MADISKFKALDGTTYDLKDATAREQLNGHSVGVDVPANAKFTDTTYNNATHSVSGLMSAADKLKLDSISNGAIYNNVINGNLSVNVNTVGSDLGLSLTVPAGVYAVTIISKFYATSNTAYVSVSLYCNPSAGGTTTNQGSSTATAQVPLQYTMYIEFTTQTVIKPYVTVSGSNVTFFDNRSIQAVKIA